MSFVSYVRQGGSILFLHSGTAQYEKRTFVCQLMGGTFDHHPPQCPVTLEAKEHPLTAGFKSFTSKDEHYHMTMNDPKVDVFLHAMSEHGKQPAGWTKRAGKGRVCVLTPGHNLEVWQHPSYRGILRHSLN